MVRHQVICSDIYTYTPGVYCPTNWLYATPPLNNERNNIMEKCVSAIRAIPVIIGGIALFCWLLVLLLVDAIKNRNNPIMYLE